VRRVRLNPVHELGLLLLHGLDQRRNQVRAEQGHHALRVGADAGQVAPVAELRLDVLGENPHVDGRVSLRPKGWDQSEWPEI
jgi:hypothetical protein